jgi:transposase
MNHKSKASPKHLFVGIDWATQEHVLCLLTSEGDHIEVLPHEPEAIAAWVSGLKKRFPKHRIFVALEQSRGALIAALREFEGLELYPINPKQLSSYRDAIVPSGAKDDPSDARLLAGFLKHHHEQLRPFEPDAPQTRKIAELSELRRKLVEERKRLVLQLGSSLDLYFPLVRKLAFGRTLYHDLMLDLIGRWPTLEQLKRVHPKRLRTFLREHGLKNEDQQTTFINAVKNAVALTKDMSLIEPRALYVPVLAGQIKRLNQAIADFDRELEELVAQHPDYDVFQSLPGAGAALIPRLIAAFGTDRQRYQSAEEIQCKSGIGPITKKSGKSQGVFKRIACPKYLRQTFHEFANHARIWSGWSNAFYRMIRAAGMKHHAAIRALAFKWIRILFRLWKTRTRYNETQYVEQLKRHNSPVVQFLETQKS